MSLRLLVAVDILSSLTRLCYTRETKQRTLEELDQVFSVPIPVFAKYQVTKSLPYFFKRWVFCRRTATLEPLYKIDDEVDAYDPENIKRRKSRGEIPV